MTARDDLDAALDAACSTDEGQRLLDAYREQLAQHRDQVLTEGAELLDRIADETEAQVAARYGPTSGLGPGSADMVRECAHTLRDHAARTAPDAP